MTDSNSGISPGSQRQMEIYKGGLAGERQGSPSLWKSSSGRPSPN